MNYKMKVTITDSNTPRGMISNLYFELNCSFCCNANSYGNGYHLSISGKGFDKQVIDLRYDKSFDCNNKDKWLEDWARSFWSGKNGAWTVKSLEITKQ